MELENTGMLWAHMCGDSEIVEIAGQGARKHMHRGSFIARSQTRPISVGS